jgi:hypothetical protein
MIAFALYAAEGIRFPVFSAETPSAQDCILVSRSGADGVPENLYA